MEIKLDAEAAAAIASAAIFDSLSQDARDSVIKQAVQSLLTPERSAYGAAKSPLQMAFDNAIREAAMQAVREKVQADPEVREGINKLLGPLLQAALSAQAEEYNTGLSTVLGDALGHWLSDQARKGS